MSWPLLPQHTSFGEMRWIICWSAGMGWELRESAGSPVPPEWEKTLPDPAPVPAAGQRRPKALAGSAHCPRREGTTDFQLIFQSGMRPNSGFSGIRGEKQLLLRDLAGFAVGRLRAVEIPVL